MYKTSVITKLLTFDGVKRFTVSSYLIFLSREK